LLASGGTSDTGLWANERISWVVKRLMRYRIEISRKAREQLRALPKEQRRNIGRRMEEMREDLRGDVRKLQAKGNYYRLRVGNFRVLFLLAGNAIQVYAVKDSKEAYE
jgi:mRNA interferase RelE/StbE